MDAPPRPEGSSVLIVDDDPVILDSLAEYLRMESWRVECAGSGREALARLKDEPFDFVITDIGMQEINGIDLLQRIKHGNPETEVIIMTGRGSEEFAVQALRAGATDYFHKPIQGEQVSASLMRAMRVRSLRSANTQLKALVTRISREGGDGTLVGDSGATRALREQLEKVAVTPHTTVLLTGESGVGKEVAARLIHRLSRPPDAPFVAINCGGIPESLLERELFGHEKGAFTGAESRAPGVFEMASGGTVMLDEISELNVGGQSRLLRVLEDRAFRRVGGTAEVLLGETRVIAATNRNLEEQVAAGAFREDLYFRLNVVPVHIPPLRERPEDILPLARLFIDRSPLGAAGELAPDAAALLEAYPFPGNVRELRNFIEHAAIFCAGNVIRAEDLIFSRLAPTAGATGPEDSLPELQPAQPHLHKSLNLEENEKRLIQAALADAENNHSAAARALGITPQTLYRRLAKYGLT